MAREASLHNQISAFAMVLRVAHQALPGGKACVGK